MRALTLFSAAAVLTLSACGGDDAAEEANLVVVEDANMMATDNMMMDANAMDANMMDANMMDANMAMDPATQNMMEQDMNTNAPDTNLANGM